MAEVIAPSAHDAAMMAKVDAAAAVTAQAMPTPMGVVPAAAPTAAVRPEYVPEKFWNAATGEVNVEGLAKSYGELEKSRTPAAPVAAPAADAPVVTAGKPNMEALSAEFATNGALSAESYAALAAAGFDKATVDGHIEGQRALAASRDQAGFAIAGGAEQFAAMATWAQTALPAADQAALNAGMLGSDAQMKLAITSLRAQYEAAVGKDPSLVKGSANIDVGTQPFASRAEVTAAMRDPKYKADPAYRAMVEARVGAMTIF